MAEIHPLGYRRKPSSVQSLSRVRLCNPMDCNTPGLPVHHQLQELVTGRCHTDNTPLQDFSGWVCWVGVWGIASGSWVLLPPRTAGVGPWRRCQHSNSLMLQKRGKKPAQGDHQNQEGKPFLASNDCPDHLVTKPWDQLGHKTCAGVLSV